MEKEKWSLKRTVGIYIEPYLAEYVSNKYKNDPKTGGVKIPYTTDLYFVVWNLMAKHKHPSIAIEPDETAVNLRIHLPNRRHGADELPGKNPAYFNYLSPTSAKKIEMEVRLMFNFELHRLLMENEEFGRPRRNIDVVYDFMHTYRLKSITPDALLKNFYRYRNRIRPKKSRSYKKNRCV